MKRISVMGKKNMRTHMTKENKANRVVNKRISNMVQINKKVVQC